MAVRPIDGNAVKRRAWDIAEAWKDQRRDYEALLLGSVVEQIVDTAPTLTLPNEPLTLDELRKMDGEPVWGKSLITGKPGEWFILHIIDMSKGKDWFISCSGASQGFGDRDTYGKTWVAYRRPPEGEEETP